MSVVYTNEIQPYSSSAVTVNSELNADSIYSTNNISTDLNLIVANDTIVGGNVSANTFYGSAIGLTQISIGVDNAVYVNGTGSPSENGNDLINKYNSAINYTPNGNPLSENNRVTVFIPPGIYHLPTPLTATTEYVDLISTTGQKDVFISASTTPLVILTDNIKLVGLSVYEYDLDVLYELGNVIVENSGNNLYTINRDVRKEEKQYYYSWSYTSGEPYPLAATSGVVTYLNIDNSTYENSNKYILFNINGSVRLKDSAMKTTIGGNFDFLNEEQVGQTTNVGSANYDTLVGSLNVGDFLEFSGTSGTFTGETLYDIGTDVFFSFISGVFNNDETLLTNLTNASTANVLGFIYPYGLYSNQIATPNIGTNTFFSNSLTNIISSIPGVCSVLFKGEPSYDAFVIFSGNPISSFWGDTQVTNDLGGTASIGVDFSTNVLYLNNPTGTWVGATTITGDITLNTRNITKFSDTWELNIKTELVFDSDYGNTNIYKI